MAAAHGRDVSNIQEPTNQPLLFHLLSWLSSTCRIAHNLQCLLDLSYGILEQSSRAISIIKNHYEDFRIAVIIPIFVHEIPVAISHTPAQIHTGICQSHEFLTT